MRAILGGFARTWDPDTGCSNIMWHNDQMNEFFIAPEHLLMTRCSIYAVSRPNAHRIVQREEKRTSLLWHIRDAGRQFVEDERERNSLYQQM